MFESFSGSSYQAILTQYSDTTGMVGNNLSVSAWTDETIVAPYGVNDGQIKAEVEYALTRTGWPGAGVDNQYVVLPAPTTKYEAGFGSEFCGYHGWQGAIGAPYAFVPWAGDQPFSGCVGYSPENRKLQATQVILSHEYAEAATDPHINAWLTNDGYEIADICSTTGDRLSSGFVVSGEWSNFRAQCMLADSAPPVAMPGEDDDLGGPHAVGRPWGLVDALFRTWDGSLGRDRWDGNRWSATTLPPLLAVGSVPHALVDPSNNGVHAFYKVSGGALGHYWSAPGSEGVETLGGSLASEPHPVVDRRGGFNVFWRTPLGGLGHAWWDLVNHKWGTETLPGSVAGAPYAVVDPSNLVVHVFYRTPSGGLGHDWHGPIDPTWGSEVLPGSVASDPRPIVDSAGGMNVFWRTPSGGLGHEWSEPGSGKWGSEILPGSLASGPHAVIDPTNGTVHVFFRNPSGGLGHDWHSPAQGNWGSETLPGSVSGDPYPVANAVGGMHVFFRTPAGGLGHEWWERSTTRWGNETIAGSLDTSESMGIHATFDTTDATNVFYRTPSGGMGHTYWYSGWFAELLPGSL